MALSITERHDFLAQQRRSGPATEEQVRQMARRYIPEDRAEPYVEFARSEHVIRMQPEHWLSSDLGPT